MGRLEEHLSKETIGAMLLDISARTPYSLATVARAFELLESFDTLLVAIEMAQGQNLDLSTAMARAVDEETKK